MKKFLLLSLSTIMLATSTNLLAFNIGDETPLIKVDSWIKNRPEQFLESRVGGSADKFMVICFWATWSNTTDNLLKFLNRETNIYKDDVQIIAISKENKKIVERFIRKFGKVEFAIAADKDSQTYNRLMNNTAGVPMFFIIGKDNKLIWKGSPFEADRVLSRVVTDTFDWRKEEKIKNWRDELQKSIEFMNFDRQTEISKEILKIDPLDTVAINNIVDDYIRQNKVDDAVKYMFESIKKSNHNKYISRTLYFSLLGVIQGMNNPNGKKYLAKTIKDYSLSFESDPDAINGFIVNIVQGMPMEIVPLKEVYDVMQKAIATHQKYFPKKKELLGVYYRTLAKIYYMSGKLNEAVKTQEKSAELLKDSEDKSLLEDINFTLAFYKEVEAASKEIK